MHSYQFTTIALLGVLVLLFAGATKVGHLRGHFAQDNPIPSQQNVFSVDDDTVAFDHLFSHVRTIPIKGTDEHSVFDLADLAVRDCLIVILDQQSATLSAFDLDGEFLYQTGQAGQAPGEFTNPSWVGFDARGRIVVLESMGNHRIQLLSAKDGQSLEVLTSDIIAPPYGKASIEGEVGAQRIIFYTFASCTDGTSGRCVVQEHDLSSGEMVRRFAPVDEVNPEARSIPWIVESSPEGRTYVSHIWGPYVAVYQQDGSYLHRFDLDKAPNFYPLDQSTLPESRREVFDALEDKEYSKVRSISAVEGDIVIDHLYAVKQSDNPKYISVFDQDGTHQASTAVDHLLRTVQGDRFFFVEENSQSDVGSYLIHEYRYEGI